MAIRVIPRDELNVIDTEVRPKGEKDAVDKVVEFIDEIIQNKEDGDVQVHLVQQSRGSGVSQNVCSFDVRAGEDSHEVAVQVVDAAINDARDGGVSGKVRYAVQASGHRGRKTFLLTFPEDGDEEFDEVPNERGALAQVMRQNADLHKVNVELMHDTVRSFKGIIGELGQQLRKHQELAADTWKAFGDLMSAHHERQLSLVKAERSEKRMDEVAGFLMTAGQVVFNSFLGKRVFQATPTPIEHLTYATMSMFEREQVEAMVAGQPLQLRTDQALGLMKLFQALDEHYKAQKRVTDGQAPPPQTAYNPSGAAGQIPAEDPASVAA